MTQFNGQMLNVNMASKLGHGWTTNRCPELVMDRQTQYRHDLHVYGTSSV